MSLIINLASILFLLNGCPDEVAVAPSTGPSAVITDIDDSEYTQLCNREPTHTNCVGTKSTNVKPTLAEVREADATLRMHFTYRSDLTMWKQGDYWTSKSLCGDCEDYALALSDILVESDYVSGGNLALLAWLPSQTVAHATLAVNTSDAGWIEIGVGAFELPRPIDWNAGRRVYWIFMDGSKTINRVGSILDRETADKELRGLY